MSISTELSRLQTARNKIRTKLIALGLVTATAKLDDCASAVDGISNQGAVSATVQEGDTYTILGVQLPYVTIPVRPGRNLAGIVEIAAMKNRQMRYGYNSARDFMTQFDKKMDELARQAKEQQ
mgnify:CR=1 FL=1